MGDISNKKEVFYYKYCPLCKYENSDKKEDWEDPCNECLTQGWNENSHKPIRYIRDEAYDEEDERKAH